MTYMERAKEVIKAHVGSAVLIDDDWVDGTSVSVPDAEESAPEREGTLDVPGWGFGVEADIAVKPNADLSEPTFSAELCLLKESALEKGLLFSGLRYNVGRFEIACKLCRHADIIVLDWNLRGEDAGEEAVRLLKAISREHATPVFVCVFTGQTSLDIVKEQIVDAVNAGSASVVKGIDTCFRIAQCVFVLRNKPGFAGSQSNVVDPLSLLDDAITALAGAYSGLVELSLLELKARYRDCLPRMLSRFGRPLDVAVLSEWADDSSPIDMGATFRGLLLDEWRATLEHAISNPGNDLRIMSEAGIRSFCCELRRQILSSGSTVQCDQLQKALQTCGSSDDIPRKLQRATIDSDTLEWLLDVKTPPPSCSAPILSDSASKRDAKERAARRARLAFLHHLSELVGWIPKGSDPKWPMFDLEALFQQQLAPQVCLTQGSVVRVATWSEKPEIAVDSSQQSKGTPENMDVSGGKVHRRLVDLLRRPIKRLIGSVSKRIEASNMRQEPSLLSQRVAVPPTFASEKAAPVRTIPALVTHLVCITPLCDAAREGESIDRIYTFLRAEVVPSSEYKDNLKRNRHIVVVKTEGELNAVLCLKVIDKPPVSLFIANTVFVKGCLQAFPWPVLSDQATASLQLTFIAQLRSDHALALVAASGASAARVGVDRTEFIRTYGD
jgi:hypothetical protein